MRAETLLLKSWIQGADSWAFILFSHMLSLTGVIAHFKMLVLCFACMPDVYTSHLAST